MRDKLVEDEVDGPQLIHRNHGMKLAATETVAWSTDGGGGGGGGY